MTASMIRPAWRRFLAVATSRAPSPIREVSTAACSRASAVSGRPSRASFWATHSLPRRRLSTSKPGGPPPEKNSRARSRRCQLPSRKARAPAQNSSVVSVTPARRACATAWLAASSWTCWCSCHSARNSSLLPPKWW